MDHGPRARVVEGEEEPAVPPMSLPHLVAEGGEELLHVVRAAEDLGARRLAGPPLRRFRAAEDGVGDEELVAGDAGLGEERLEVVADRIAVERDPGPAGPARPRRLRDDET